MEVMPDLKVIIKADRRPAGKYAWHFYAPAINEVTIILVGEGHVKSDIVLKHHDNHLSLIKKTHRSHMIA